MPAKTPPAPRYVITGILVGPFRAGEEVDAEQIRAAGLNPDHLVRCGLADRVAAAPAPKEEA